LPGGDAVVAEHLAKRYPGGVWGVRDASLRAGRGSITVLLGPNGAGKTTTVGMLSTILRPTRGRGLVLGLDVVADAWRVRRLVALMPQECRIDLNWTPYEMVKWYLVVRGMSLHDASLQARRWLERLGLWECRSTPGWRLSGGQRRKAIAAAVLASEAPVVFLDEPTAELDVESKYTIWGAVRAAASEGRTVILTTHDMREAELLADHVVLMVDGRTVVEDSPENLIASLGYRYRVVLWGAAEPPAGNCMSVSGTLLCYASTWSEAASIARSANASKVVVEEVGLEDVYIRYASPRGGSSRLSAQPGS